MQLNIKLESNIFFKIEVAKIFYLNYYSYFNREQTLYISLDLLELLHVSAEAKY